MSENVPGPYGQQGNQPDYNAGQQPYPSGQPGPYGQQGNQSGQAGQFGQQGYGPGYGGGQSGYGAPGGYGSPGGYGTPPPENPGRTLGIVGLICAIIWPISVIGLIISIVAMVKSKKAGMGNGLALAGIIVGAVGLITGILAAIFFVFLAGETANIIELCQNAGPGMQEYRGEQINCSDLQFNP